MSGIADSSVTIQVSAQSVPATPGWFGEVAIIAGYLRHQDVFTLIEERVRFARRRFERYDIIDFVAVLLGYALSGERSLEAFYERLQPFAQAFMALFGRDRLPARSTVSCFLAALDHAPVEALRTLFLDDLLARPLKNEEEVAKAGGLWDRQGTHGLVFDIDGTRQAARQRAVPCTPALPPASRRFDQVCAPGYLGRKRGEVVRTRTTVLQAHTYQWLGTFGGAGNGDYRGELRQAVKAIRTYVTAQHFPLSQAVVRLDGQYGNGAIVADLAGLTYVLRGKDYDLLDLPQVQTRLGLPPDQQTSHPETGTYRALFDCPDLPLTPTGPHARVIVATHPATTTAAPIGTTRGEVVYELFYTALPGSAFTPADVVALYLHRGAFETVLSDEDQEQDPDRWCSRTAGGQEFWQILAQWVWNLRLELGHALHPTPMRSTEFAPAQAEPGIQPDSSPPAPVSYQPPEWAVSRMGCLAGSHFTPQPDGTLLCPAHHPLYPQERRPERDGRLRVLYAARIRHCRPCPLREACQGYGAATKKPRRVSAVLWPAGTAASPRVPLPPLPAPHAILWGDWERRTQRRAVMQLLRHQRVDVRLADPSSPPRRSPARPLSRAERAHWRLSWAERLARNARERSARCVEITLFGVPPALAALPGLFIV